MSLRHQPISDGALMAQQVCAAINRCPKGKGSGAMARHHLSPNGAPMAQWQHKEPATAENKIEEELDLLEVELTFETHWPRQQRLALMIQSRRLQLEAMAEVQP